MNEDNKVLLEEGIAVSNDEQSIIKGILDSATTTVKTIMTRKQEVF